MEDEELERIKAKKMESIISAIRRRETMASGPISVTDASFDVVVVEHPLFALDCWAAWCGPCKMIAPIIDELARIYWGKVAFGKLNVDENPKTALRFNVLSVPTLLIFKEAKLVDRIVGAVPRIKIESALKTYFWEPT
jgi:thioredoxin 1